MGLRYPMGRVENPKKRVTAKMKSGVMAMETKAPKKKGKKDYLASSDGAMKA